MKNIHVLPTDKPSRLILQTNNKLRISDIVFQGKIASGITQNIYITSDEEIKEGDWCLYGFNLESVYEGGKDWEITENGVIKCINFSALGYLIHNGGTTGKEFCKKIILTTDQDLIKDGVQAIDDEFLEWFVNNPSCEEVEIEPLMAGFIDDEPSYYENMYKIII